MARLSLFRPPARRTRGGERVRRPYAMLVKAEDLLARGASDDLVLETLHTIGELTEPDHLTRAGGCFLDVGEPSRAEVMFDRSLAIEASADALHGKGYARSLDGDFEAATQAWLRVMAMDLAAPRPEWALSADEFEAIIEDALAELPRVIRERLVNVPIIAEEYPSRELIEDGVDPRLLGLFAGTPMPFAAEANATLDQVLIFQRNIERIAGDRDTAELEVRITLIHETGHFFGLEDDDLDALGLG